MVEGMFHGSEVSLGGEKDTIKAVKLGRTRCEHK